jgi:hypothetical protein
MDVLTAKLSEDGTAQTMYAKSSLEMALGSNLKKNAMTATNSCLIEMDVMRT